MERTLGVTEARKELTSIVEQAQHRGDSTIISRYGEPAAAVVPIEVYEGWRRQRAEFFDLIRGLQSDAGLSPDDADQLAAEAVEAARAQS